MFRGLLIMITQRLRKELLKIIFLKKIKTKKTCVRILIKFSRKAGLFLCFPCPDIIGILSGCCKNTLWLKDIDTGRIMGGFGVPSLAASQVFPSPKTRRYAYKVELEFLRSRKSDYFIPSNRSFIILQKEFHQYSHGKIYHPI